MSQAGKVAEIFSLAGETFTKLGTLAMSLQQTNDKIQDGGKWGEEEVEMLKNAIAHFGEDIEKISTLVRTKSTTQIKTALKQKAMQNLVVSKNLSDLNSKNPISNNQQQRQIGQKSKATNILYSPNVTEEFNSKKVKIDAPNMSIMSMLPQQQQQGNTSILSSRLPSLSTSVLSSFNSSQKVNNSFQGIPVIASGQGFQVILPQSNAGISGSTVTVLNSGVVQPMIDTSNSSLNVDVEG